MTMEQYSPEESLRSEGQDLGSSIKREAERAKQAAADAAHNVGERAESAKTAVGGRMKDLAGRLRERAPEEGMIGSAAQGVARTLEDGGEYLQEHNFGDMAKDVTDVVRTHPIPSVLVALGLGILIGRSLRS
jgi:hypothetical protein